MCIKVRRESAFGRSRKIDCKRYPSGYLRLHASPFAQQNFTDRCDLQKDRFAAGGDICGGPLGSRKADIETRYGADPTPKNCAAKALAFVALPWCLADQ